MRPIPVGASAAMVFSSDRGLHRDPLGGLAVASRPVASGHGHGDGHDTEDWATRLYRSVMDHLLHNQPVALVFFNWCGGTAFGRHGHGRRGAGQGEDAAFRQQE